MTEKQDHTLEARVQQLAHGFFDALLPGWQLSPVATLEALALVVEAMAVRYVVREPRARDLVLARLSSIASAVDAGTAPCRSTTH